MPTPNTSAPLPAFWVNASGGSVLSAADATMPVGFLALRVSVALAYGLVGAVGLLGNSAVETFRWLPMSSFSISLGYNLNFLRLSLVL